MKIGATSTSEHSSPRAFWLVSFGGIHFFPTLIVFAGMVAVYPALVTGERSLGLLDGLALVIGLGGVAFEWFADNQLRAFVLGPKQPGETLRNGLWLYSRHPNYLGEIMIWWSLFLFGYAADPEWLTWGLIGPVSMTVMFLGGQHPAARKKVPRTARELPAGDRRNVDADSVVPEESYSLIA